MISLEVKNLSKTFKNKQVLKNINIQFFKNKVYGLIGNNGTGKTTLLKCIFNEFTVDQGEIYFQDHLIKQSDFLKMYFFPENNDLPKNITVLEYLQRVSIFYNLKLQKDILQNIKLKLKITNLNKTKIADLSSGQQKYISIICCELINPDIVFFDEPTANLDIENKQIILQKITQFKNQSKTIILITHLIEEIKDYLDEVIVIDNKTIKVQFSAKNKNITKEFLNIINFKGDKLNEN